jgi:hypothetical protein
MLQDPKADETQGFKEEWLKHAGANPFGLNVFIVIDPASAKKKDSDYTAAGSSGSARTRTCTSSTSFGTA